MAKKKVEKIATPEQAPSAEEPKAEPVSVPQWIRMKITLGTPKRCFTAGLSLKVGEDVSAEIAQSWLASGAAEEDKSLHPEIETK